MFRNYQQVEISPHADLNIIIGKNAQGKTNLLEAIFFNINGCSFRAVNDKDVINWQNDYCSVTAVVENNGYKWKQTAAFHKTGSKKFFINGVEKKKKDLKSFGVVLFTPDDLTLIKNSPAVRRKFLDQEVGSFYNTYTDLISKYNKIVNQRNHLLKSIRAAKENALLLDVWNQQLVDNGTSVLLLRLEILKKLAPIVKKWYYELTDGKEKLDLKYLSSLKIEAPADENSLKKRFYQVLNEIQTEEIKRCQTLVGPHRDDICFFVDDKNARSFGSQGQQRTIVLSLKLALMTLFNKEFNSNPIVLLDDVLFELDEVRQNMLLDKLNNGVQTFITANQFNQQILKDKNYRLFKTENGYLTLYK